MKSVTPYAVNNLAQAIIVWDPKNLLPKIKERVGFYSKDMKKIDGESVKYLGLR